MVRLRQRRPARPDHRQLRRLVAGTQLLLWGPRSRHAELLPSRRSSTASPRRSITTTGRHLHRREQILGLGAKGGNGLGVVTFDYDNDGWQDIFIANDHMPNFLFHNNRDGTFREVGYRGGRRGQWRWSVRGRHGNRCRGHDRQRAHGSDRTHLDMQLARLYQNWGDQTFDDATSARNLVTPPST